MANDRSRAMPPASDRYAARLVFQSVSVLIDAEYSRLTLGLPRHGTCEQMPRLCAVA
jgi:hypothetical protein